LCGQLAETPRRGSRRGRGRPSSRFSSFPLEPVCRFPSTARTGARTAYPRATIDSLKCSQSKTAMQFPRASTAQFEDPAPWPGPTPSATSIKQNRGPKDVPSCSYRGSICFCGIARDGQSETEIYFMAFSCYSTALMCNHPSRSINPALEKCRRFIRRNSLQEFRRRLSKSNNVSVDAVLIVGVHPAGD
jgi:hypothetical protein